MIDNISVSEIMTSPIVTVGPHETMNKIVEIFDHATFHHLPVVDDNQRVLGILSKHDYYKMQNAFSIFSTDSSRRANTSFFRSVLVREVMTKQPVVLQLDDPVAKAYEYFRENLFHAVPVVDAENKLRGIVTTFDLLAHAYRELV